MRRTNAAKRYAVPPLMYRMGRMGIQRSNPAAEMTNAVANMILDPCKAKLTSGGFGFGPTSINRFTSTYTFPMNSSPVGAPYTSGYVLYFPGYACPKTQDAIPTVGECGGALFVWASPSSSASPANAGGSNSNPSGQWGRALYDANSTSAPLTAESIATPDYAFLKGVASSTQLVASCIDLEFLGPALSAGGEVFAINGVDPNRMIGGASPSFIGGDGLSVDNMALVYGSEGKAIKPGSCFSTKFFSRSPNTSRRLTVGEGLVSITRSTTAAENQTVITTDTDIFSPLGYGIGFRNVPISAVPGSSTAITSGVKDLRFKFTVIKEWNAVVPVGLSNQVTLPVGANVHDAASNLAASTLRSTTGSSFQEMGRSADRIMANPTVQQVVHEGVQIGTRFARTGRVNRDG